MDKETQAYFKEVLLKRLDELYSEAEKTVAGMTDNEENFPDPTDRATLESDRNFMLRIRDRERKLIIKDTRGAPKDRGRPFRAVRRMW